jgi:ABC-type multidrug transport system ATPase subunit
MLRCIVGRVWPKSGSVMVFGLRPGEGLGEVPGRDVGYMPQEISIYEDFTIEETLNYFGKINRMAADDIRKRVEFLLQFLDLPSKRRSVANLR